jgi:hypothetical protein
MMPGTGDPHLDAILSQIGSGGGAAQNTGPSASRPWAATTWQAARPRWSTGASSLPRTRAAETPSGRGMPGWASSRVGPRRSLQDAVADWYKWSDQERSAFGQRLYKLGLVKDPNDYGAVFNTWQERRSAGQQLLHRRRQEGHPVAGSGPGGGWGRRRQAPPRRRTPRSPSTSPRLRTPTRPRSSSSRP